MNKTYQAPAAEIISFEPKEAIMATGNQGISDSIFDPPEENA